ncbi:MAG: hypothetical protein ACE5O2_02790 [Armatimonadota bacterium]
MWYDGWELVASGRSGWRPTPWCVAENLRVARALIDAALVDFPDRTIIVGVPGAARGGADLLRTCGFTRGPATLRMVHGDASVGCNAGAVIAVANSAMG